MVFLSFFLCVIFFHLANIKKLKAFYEPLIKRILNILASILSRIKEIIQRIYYLIRYEFLYALGLFINILILLSGGVLIFYGVIDPNGTIIEGIIGINLISIFFPNFNQIFELLFGISLVVVAIILNIILNQSKSKKLHT